MFILQRVNLLHESLFYFMCLAVLRPNCFFQSLKLGIGLLCTCLVAVQKLLLQDFDETPCGIVPGQGKAKLA